MIEVVDSFPRGGDVRLALDFSSTDGERPTDIDLVEADLRFAGAKPAIVTEAMPKVGQFAIALRGNDAGWFATIADTAELALGWYVADLRITVGGVVSIGPPLTFQIVEAVTRRPE